MDISLMNDLAFKYVFGAEEHAHRLMAFLNAVLHYEGDEKIQEIGIKNPFIMGKTETEKTVILDVRAIDGRNRHYTIEVQIKPDDFYVNRVVCYGAKVLAAQLEKGERYHLLEKVISLSILDHTLHKEQDEVQAMYRLRHAKTGIELTDLMEFHFIELPRYEEREPPLDAPLSEKWINLIKYSREYVKPGAYVPEALRNEEEIVMALESFKKMTADEEMRMLLEEREKSRMDLNSMLYEAQIKGKIEGKIEGKVEGKAEGEREKAQNIAKRMLFKGKEREEVKDLTGLSDEEMEGL